MAVSSCAWAKTRASSSSLGLVSRAGLPSRSSSSAWPSTRGGDLRFLVALLAALDQVGDALFEAFEVGQQQLGLDHLGVGDRVDLVGDMLDVVILEAAQDMDDRVDLADVAEELVAEPFALGRALHQPGDVDEAELGRDDLGRAGDGRELVEARIGHRDLADVRLDRAERIIGRLRRLRLGQRVEEGRLADVRQADDAAFKAHWFRPVRRRVLRCALSRRVHGKIEADAEPVGLGLARQHLVPQPAFPHQQQAGSRIYGDEGAQVLRRILAADGAAIIMRQPGILEADRAAALRAPRHRTCPKGSNAGGYGRLW